MYTFGGKLKDNLTKFLVENLNFEEENNNSE